MRLDVVAVAIAMLCPLTILAAPAIGEPLEIHREAYFGDLHEHTTFSLDAYMLFRTGVTPDGAYQFANGSSLTFPTISNSFITNGLWGPSFEVVPEPSTLALLGAVLLAAALRSPAARSA